VTGTLPQRRRLGPSNVGWSCCQGERNQEIEQVEAINKPNIGTRPDFYPKDKSWEEKRSVEVFLHKLFTLF